MAKAMIPMRPEGFAASGLTQDEQAALTWMVLSGCPRKDAVLTFVRPDMLESRAKAAVDDYIKQFFSRREVREYIEAYQKTIDETLHPKQKVNSVDSNQTLEERKSLSKQKLLEFTMTIIDHIDQAEDPEAVMKMADKVGLLDTNEDAPEEPRRYLPVRCLSECRYRLFVEKNCEDECQYCKYKADCEERGIHFEPTEQLDVPVPSVTGENGTVFEQKEETN